MTSPHDLIVDFDSPPVAEVALIVQLQGATLDSSHAISAFYPTVAANYPEIVPQAPAPPLEESFEIPGPGSIAFQLFGGAEAQRWSFENPDRTEAIQVQRDRFVYVWAKEETNSEYPHYGEIRDRFQSAFNSYLRVTDGAVQSTWCEIAYSNPIFQAEGEMRPDLSTLLKRLVPQDLPGLPTPYNTGLEERFQLERDGSPYARFFIAVQSIVAPVRRLGYTINLTMRGRPVTQDIDGALAFFDEGRERIVTTFREITTPEQHAAWGLR